MTWVSGLHAAATGFMVGAIWFVQIVHYPLLAGVGRGGFPAYAREHVERTGRIVVLPMLVEAATAVWLVLDDGVGPSAWVGLALVGVIWTSTALLQVPAHRRLSHGFDVAAHRRLVHTNWIRTVVWTLRGALVLSWFA